MKIRGWLIMGPPESSMGFPPAATAGIARGSVPKASEYSPGTWILWTPAPSQEPIVLVCIEVPL